MKANLPDEQDILEENDSLRVRVQQLEAALAAKATGATPAPIPAAPRASASRATTISTGATPPLSGNGQPPAPAVGQAPVVPEYLRHEMLWGRRAGSLSGKATVAALILALSDAVVRRTNPYKEGTLSHAAFEGAEDRRIADELTRRKMARSVKSDEADQPSPEEHPPGAILTSNRTPGLPWSSTPTARATEEQNRLEARRDELMAMAQALHGKIVATIGSVRTVPTPTSDTAADIAALERFVSECRADLIAHGGQSRRCDLTEDED